jgi:hypothetical protein
MNAVLDALAPVRQAFRHAGMPHRVWRAINGQA